MAETSEIPEDMDLLPCPFCGGDNLDTTYEDIDGWIASVRCIDCADMIGPMSEFKYPDKSEARADAAIKWNTRAPIASSIRTPEDESK